MTSKEFYRSIHEMLRMYRPNILGLVETKTNEAMADHICRKLGFDVWLRVEAVGFSGGILVFWNDYITVEPLQTHPQLFC